MEKKGKHTKKITREIGEQNRKKQGLEGQGTCDLKHLFPDSFHSHRVKRANASVVKISGPKKHGNGNVQANVRANNSGQFEGTVHENVGVSRQKGTENSPELRPEHYHGISLLSAPLKNAASHVCRSCRFLVRTPEGSYFPTGRSRHLLESPLL